MPVLHVPASLRAISGDRDRFDVDGATLRAVFRAVGAQCPELIDRIIEDDELRSDIAVALDGTILDDGNLTKAVSADAEIYLVPPIGGGSGSYLQAPHTETPPAVRTEGVPDEIEAEAT